MIGLRYIYSVGIGGIPKIVVGHRRYDPRSSTGWERVDVLVQALLRPTMDRLVLHIYSVGVVGVWICILWVSGGTCIRNHGSSWPWASHVCRGLCCMHDR